MGIETPLRPPQSDNQLRPITLGGCAPLEVMHRVIFVGWQEVVVFIVIVVIVMEEDGGACVRRR